MRSFADLIAPIDEETFFAEYYGRKPVHIPGPREKLAAVMNWAEMDRLINTTPLWSDKTLMMVLDGETLPAPAYCREAKDRDGRTGPRPAADLVNALLAKGASVVLNEVDALTPGLAGAAAILEGALDAKVQGNLYCSWKAHKAFRSHMDTHDVFALHVEGEKTWYVYEGRDDWPVNHPAFKARTQAEIEEAKGAVLMEVTLTPGDVLYIPRGQYHDALAQSGGTVHIAFGAVSVIGLDVIGALNEVAVGESLFRRNLPRRAEGEDALKAHLAALGDRLKALSADPGFVAAMARHQEGWRYPRAGVALPLDGTAAAWQVRGSDFAVVELQGRPALKGPGGAVPIPPPAVEPVRWAIARGRFAEEELLAAFPDRPAGSLVDVLTQLERMKVVARAG